ncbi:unnamed protein product [Caenorhabditis auriculariae]|uniref:L-Fucosyltransferase n=1 Tax=Caenorhabditis auriculariae TaxID=2777116 RepID=A0A8S1GMK5_9PELO|nr:unnamed protein product [Caenorhabditis auriculariae]
MERGYPGKEEEPSIDEKKNEWIDFALSAISKPWFIGLKTKPERIWRSYAMINRRLAFYLFAIISLVVLVHLRSRSRWYNYEQFPPKKFCTGVERTEKNHAGKSSKGFITFPMTSLRFAAGIALCDHSSQLGRPSDPRRSSVSAPVLPLACRPRFTTKHSERQNVNLMDCDDSEFLIIDGEYFQSFKYFRNIEVELRRMLAPSEEQKRRARSYFSDSLQNTFKICCHVRRGDFLTDAMHQGSDPDFLLRAIAFLTNYFQRRNVHVIIFNNDPSWVRKEVIPGMSLSPEKVTVTTTAASDFLEDLILAQVHCDAFLLTGEPIRIFLNFPFSSVLDFWLVDGISFEKLFKRLLS